MKLTAISVASLLVIAGHAGAFMLPLHSPRQHHYFDLRGKATTAVRPASQGALLARENDPEVSVFDAEGAVSWDDYKTKKTEEFKMNEEDERQCWATGECPVEEDAKFTKAWQIRSAERNPTTETHFDSEGEWEEVNKRAWAKKWYEDVGEDDLVKDSDAKNDASFDI